jgi:hypothetical protein
MTTDRIYVALLDEGTAVWRPVSALKIDQNTYVILQPDDYDAEDEKWEFPPGSVVVVEERKTADGAIQAAVRRNPAGRLSA